MRPTESAYPTAWYGTDLAVAGLEQVRPRLGTYGRYSYEQLPAIPFELRGDFEWLEHAPSHEGHIGDEKGTATLDALAILKEASSEMGFSMPPSFERFLGDQELWSRVRSCTDCFLDLCPGLVPDPKETGHLVRFLADSQSCMFWYLYLVDDGRDHAILASPDFYGVEAEQWTDDPPNPEELVFCADSFESFMARFWLENEIWFAGYDRAPLSVPATQYVAAYRRHAEELRDRTR